MRHVARCYEKAHGGMEKMWHFIKTTLRTDPEDDAEYFGPFVSLDTAEEFAEHAFDPQDVEVEHLKMYEVESGRVK